MLVISGASNDSCDEGWGVMARQWQICQNENVSIPIDWTNNKYPTDFS
jgi:hypothetical protein